MIIKVTQTCIALWFIFFVPPVSHESMRMAWFLFGPKCRVWCLFGGAQSMKHKPPVKTQDLCKFSATHLLKTSQKYCACHTERLSTRYKTRLNVTKCHACHAKRSNDTSETSKNDHLCRTSHRHGHTGIARTVADGCERLRM